MNISKGFPPVTGRYVVYLTTDNVASTVRFFIAGENRWVPHLTDERGRFPHDVTGWIGPLPDRKIEAVPIMEFDL